VSVFVLNACPQQRCMIQSATAQRCPWDFWIGRLLSLTALRFAVRSLRPCRRGCPFMLLSAASAQCVGAHQVWTTYLGLHLLAHAESFTTPPALQPPQGLLRLAGVAGLGAVPALCAGWVGLLRLERPAFGTSTACCSPTVWVGRLSAAKHTSTV
jgi:hypothetical protein